jgi:hypothetical protein
LTQGEAEATHQQNRQHQASHRCQLSRSRSPFPINFCGRANAAMDKYYLPSE